jgi:hypothetical protein
VFRLACRLTGKLDWAQPENLILMTRKRLWQLAASLPNWSAAVGYTGLRLGPFSSNLFLVLQ